jgi:hypothetical protein
MSTEFKPRSLLTSLDERVIGYFLAGGLFRGSTVYVTTERIIVNKGRGPLSLRAHFLVALSLSLLVLVGPLVPASVALAILLAIATIIALLLLKRKSFRRKWPSVEHVERGHRQFEVKRGQALSIELKRPGRLRSGHVVITSLSNEPFDLKILGERVFKVARNLMARFDASRVKVDGEV